MFPVEVVTRGYPIPVVVDLGPHHHELVRVGVRHGGDQRPVNNRKDSGIGANTQRKRQQRDDGEAEILAQDAETETDVAPESCHAVYPLNLYTRAPC